MIDNRLMDFAKMPYEAPSVTSLDILSEGLLCQSGFNDRADNDYDPSFDLGEI